MAFPVTITPTDPDDIDSPSLGAQEFRNLKQALIDLFGLPSGIPIAAAASPTVMVFYGTAVPAGNAPGTFLGRDDDLTELNVQGRVPLTGIITKIWTQASVAAGAGETHTFTLRLASADTALVSVATGAPGAGRTSNAAGAIPVTEGTTISIKLVTSAAAGVANHFVAIAIQPTPV